MFKLPIKKYDRQNIAETMEALNQEEPDYSVVDKPEWVTVMAAVPFDEILTWHQDTIQDMNVKELVSHGTTDIYDAVYIRTKSWGQLECIWSMETFEKELDRQYEAYAKKYENEDKKAENQK